MYKISKMVCASKTAFASKIALATILLGFLFVGGASLQAQEGSENGWFVSASPLIFGASKIETKTTITGGGGEVTVGDLTADIRTDFFDADTTNLAQNSARDLCAGTLVGVCVVVLLRLSIFATTRNTKAQDQFFDFFSISIKKINNSNKSPTVTHYKNQRTRKTAFSLFVLGVL